MATWILSVPAQLLPRAPFWPLPSSCPMRRPHGSSPQPSSCPVSWPHGSSQFLSSASAAWALPAPAQCVSHLGPCPSPAPAQCVGHMGPPSPCPVRQSLGAPGPSSAVHTTPALSTLEALFLTSHFPQEEETMARQARPLGPALLTLPRAPGDGDRATQPGAAQPAPTQVPGCPLQLLECAGISLRLGPGCHCPAPWPRVYSLTWSSHDVQAGRHDNSESVTDPQHNLTPMWLLCGTLQERIKCEPSG